MPGSLIWTEGAFGGAAHGAEAADLEQIWGQSDFSHSRRYRYAVWCHTISTDGNLTQDATYEYAWDGENRLIGIEPVSPNSGDKKIAFVYDYMGRRVRKTVSTYDASTWAVASDLSFVYDGWNVLGAEKGTSLIIDNSSPPG